MSKLDTIKPLWERIKAPGQTIDTLNVLLSDYSKVLGEVIGSDDEYRSSLRRLQEEIPDLQRLVGKKHDAILKGRLQDAIGALKKKVEAIEAPPALEPEAGVPDSGGAGEMTVSLQEEEIKKPFRNMPSLGMD